MLTSSSANIESILKLINKKNLLDCLRDSFASYRGKKELDLYEVIKQMSFILESSPEEYLGQTFESSDLTQELIR